MSLIESASLSTINEGYNPLSVCIVVVVVDVLNLVLTQSRQKHYECCSKLYRREQSTDMTTR